MSLYNLIHGMNPDADSLLKIIGKSKGDFGRFRDVYVEKSKDAKPRIIVYKRCGGGNREDYQSVFDDMATHPDFLFDQDDEFDSTYCSFVFSVPESKGES